MLLCSSPLDKHAAALEFRNRRIVDRVGFGLSRLRSHMWALTNHGDILLRPPIRSARTDHRAHPVQPNPPEACSVRHPSRGLVENLSLRTPEPPLVPSLRLAGRPAGMARCRQSPPYQLQGYVEIPVGEPQPAECLVYCRISVAHTRPSLPEALHGLWFTPRAFVWRPHLGWLPLYPC